MYRGRKVVRACAVLFLMLVLNWLVASHPVTEALPNVDSTNETFRAISEISDVTAGNPKSVGVGLRVIQFGLKLAF
jgi:hypothetical protein